jgi:hypothetical protein
MAQNFEDIMSQETDEDLFKIVTGPANDYQPAALEAAQKEFAKRNLSEEQLSEVKHKIEVDDKIKNDKANEPLETWWKILTFAFPGIIQIIFSGGFRINGYDRKASEFVRWTIYGFGFYIGLILLIKALD